MEALARASLAMTELYRCLSDSIPVAGLQSTSQVIGVMEELEEVKLGINEVKE